MNDVLPNIMQKTKESYDLPFASCAKCIISFDLWMFHVGTQHIAMIVNLINNSWELTPNSEDI
jgi:hypothetical protein